VTATAIFAVPAALAWFGLYRFNPEAARTLALVAIAVLWATTVALVATWS